MPLLPFSSAPSASGGSGTVTGVSVVTANGVSGSVANPTTTPAITLTLGAITPTSIGSATTATTQSAGDNSTLLATDAFVTTAVANAISGVNPAVAVQYATTAAANTSGLTYNNGVSGVGATFTGANNTATTIDGHTFVVGDVGITRLLVKNDTQAPSGAFNGVYLFTALHTVGTGDVFTRALDYDTPSDINNTGAIPVISGTANAQTSWVETANIVTVGTTPLAFTQFTLNPTTLMTTSTYDPAAIAQQVVGTTATQTLTNKTLTSPTINTPTITWTNNTVTAASLATTAINLGQAQITANITTTATSVAAATGLSVSVTIPAGGRATKVTVQLPEVDCSADPKRVYTSIWDGTVGSGTQITSGVQVVYAVGGVGGTMTMIAYVTPSAGAKTYNVGWYTDSANTATIVAATTAPAFILVEAI
jgi:hypothetical protein